MPPRPSSLVDFALETLREEIIRGDLEPGSSLRLRDHAKRLGISPVPLREALHRLEQAGLVVWTRNQGVRVAAASIADMEDTYRVRIALEVLAIRESSARFSENDDKTARYWLQQYATSTAGDDPATARAAHAEFHLALYRPAGSPWLERLIPQLSASSERYRRMALGGLGPVEIRTREHRRLLTACRAHRPDDAEQALRRHFELTQQVIRERLNLRALSIVPRADASNELEALGAG
jgi:DNA-binding GntR family transcriptional regulator